MWDGGYENGVFYDRSGKPLFQGKMLTGTPPSFLGGPNAVAKGAVWLAQMANKYKGAQTSATQIGKLYKYTVSVPGKNGHTVYTKILNAEGKTLKWFHDTYDKTGKFLASRIGQKEARKSIYGGMDLFKLLGHIFRGNEKSISQR